VDYGPALGPRGSGLRQRNDGGFVPVSVGWENGGFGISINADYVGVLLVGRTGDGGDDARMEMEEGEKEEEEEKGSCGDFHFFKGWFVKMARERLR
jgi:hypothetical protein